MNTSPTPSTDSLAVFNVIVSAYVGFLIAFPFSLEKSPLMAGLTLVPGIIAGTLVGFRRKNSRSFLYFALFVAVTVSTVTFFQTLASPK